MDRIDQKILNQLQADARIPLAQLANAVGLTASPCHRRIKRLETVGIISGYSVNIDQERYGMMVNAFVSVKLRHSTDNAMKVFENEIQSLDEVIECCLVSGKQDYLLRVVSKTLKTYEEFIRHRLTKVAEVDSVESIFCFGQVKQKSRLPTVIF